MDAITDVVGKAFERSNALQTYWTFYTTGVLGLLAFFGSKKREGAIVAILIFSFIGFAWANLSALQSVTRQREALQTLIDTRYPLPCGGNRDCEVAHSIAPSSFAAVTGLHLVGDAGAVIGIWFLTRGKSNHDLDKDE